MDHNVEHGTAECQPTYQSWDHNVELVFVLFWCSYRNKIHNVEYALEAVVDVYAKWMRVRFVCMLGPKFTDSLCEEGF